MLIGIFLIFFGAILLLKELGLITLTISLWELVLPILLLTLGVYIVIGAFKVRKYKRRFFHKFIKPFWEDDTLEQ